MIYHIARRDEWEAARRSGEYTPSGFTADGFVHCSMLAQVVESANRFFRGQRGLILVAIDERKLVAPLRYEIGKPPAGTTSEPSRAIFPHLYGALNLGAVTAEFDFDCRSDGTFELPQPLISRLI